MVGGGTFLCIFLGVVGAGWVLNVFAGLSSGGIGGGFRGVVGGDLWRCRLVCGGRGGYFFF